CKLDERSWTQACLKVSSGGLGLRDAKDLCFSSFLGSTHFVEPLVRRLLPIEIRNEADTEKDTATENWSHIVGKEPLLHPESCYQKNWDSEICETKQKLLFDTAATEEDKARLLACA